MLDAPRICLAKFFDLSTRPSSSKLFLQTLVRIRLDVEDIVPLIASYLPNMGRIGVERVFNQEDFLVGIARRQGGAEALGGVAFTVVFLGAVGLEDGFKVEREDFLVVGVQKDSRQSRMV